MGNVDELLSVSARVEECDVEGLMQEITDWANEEMDNKDVYNTLNTVAYMILEHCTYLP